MTYTKRKKEEAEAGDGRFCATTPFEIDLKTGWGWLEKKHARPTLFFEFRKAEWRYGLSLVYNTLAPGSSVGRSLLSLVERKPG